MIHPQARIYKLYIPPLDVATVMTIIFYSLSFRREFWFGRSFRKGSKLVSGDGGVDIELVPGEYHPNVRVQVNVTGFRTLNPVSKRG